MKIEYPKKLTAALASLIAIVIGGTHEQSDRTEAQHLRDRY